MILPLVLSLAAGAAASAGDLAQTTSIQLPQGRVLRSADFVDLNADGRSDVLVVSVPEADPYAPRLLQIHTRRPKQGFASTPDYELELTGDVVAYCVADVHADPGAELVLFTASGAFAWRPLATDERERFGLLLRADFLWQVPSRGLIRWNHGARDLDGDGLVDLLLPEPDGYRIAFQRRAPASAGGAVTFDESVLTVPTEHDPEYSGFAPIGSGDTAGVAPRDRRSRGSGGAKGGDVSIRLGGDSSDFSGTLLRVTSALPAPQLFDWDADGDVDVLAQGRRKLFVWTQDAGGSFARDPALQLELPVAAADRQLDISYSSHARDLDADGRVDCMILSGDRRSKDVRSHLQVFTQRKGAPLFPADGLPTQLLVLAGFAGAPRLDDVNGDGLPDLIVGALRPDLIDSIRSASSKRLDIELYVFLNQRGSFSRKPDLSHELSIPVDSDDLVFRFFADVTGDGLRELVTRIEPERLAVLYTRRQGDGLVVFDKPLWELRVDKDAEIRLLEAQGEPPQLLIVEPSQWIHVEFGS